MFWPELYSGRQNNNSLEGTPRFVEKHDCSQSKYPARIGKTCEEGRSSFYSSIPSSYCVYEPQHLLIDDNIIYKGDSGSSAYAPPLNAVNVISNSFSIHHESRCGKTENNSLEINPAAYLRKQSEPSALTWDGGGNNFFNIQDFMDERSYSLNPVNKRGKRKPRKAETAAHIRAGRKAHINLQVKRTTRDLKGSRISGPSGRVDRHSKVLTSKGPRDRRIRLSVGTAIKLYWLQDRLGFDQPSKAVEWLIKKSQAAILELPQISSISCSDISQYVDYNSAAVSVSCHQTGDLSTLSQDNTCTASGDCLVKPYEQMLAANTCLGQTSSLVTATERNNRGTIIRGEKREQRSMAMSSVSSRILRAAANSVRRKEFRAKARERARERTKETEKRYNQHSGIYGLLQPSSVPSQSPTFSLHNTSSASSLNMINETRDANSNRDDFLHSLMFPKSSTLCSRSNICISSPPAEIQLSLPSVHCSSTQQEGISIQSTGALSSIHPEVFRVTSDPFPQTAATSNNSSSHFKFCTYPPDHSHLESSIFGGSCREDSIAMAGAHDGRLETSYEWQPERNKEFFQELQVNEEIPSIKSSNEYVPSRVILSNPPAYIGIFDLLQ